VDEGEDCQWRREREARRDETTRDEWMFEGVRSVRFGRWWIGAEVKVEADV
jgi:hypothetical protein